jgi:hypothetical protein
MDEMKDDSKTLVDETEEKIDQTQIEGMEDDTITLVDEQGHRTSSSTVSSQISSKKYTSVYFCSSAIGLGGVAPRQHEWYTRLSLNNRCRSRH